MLKIIIIIISLLLNSTIYSKQLNSPDKSKKDENEIMNTIEEISSKVEELKEKIKKDLENTLYESAKQRCRESLKLLREEGKLIDEILWKTEDNEKKKFLLKRRDENEKNVKEIKEILAILEIP